MKGKCRYSFLDQRLPVNIKYIQIVSIRFQYEFVTFIQLLNHDFFLHNVIIRLKLRVGHRNLA